MPVWMLSATSWGDKVAGELWGEAALGDLESGCSF